MKRPISSAPRYEPANHGLELLHWGCIGGGVGLGFILFLSFW